MTDATPQPTAPQSSAPQPVPAGPLTPAEDKQWASLAHFGGILAFVPALIIFLVFKDRGALTRQESKEALNWQITWIGANIVVSVVLAIVGGIVLLATGSDAVFTLSRVISGLLYVANVVFSIMGGIKVNGGGAYRYPVAVRLIK